MQKKISLFLTLILAVLVLFFYQCTNEDKTKINPLYPVSEKNTVSGDNFTIPGPVFFTLDSSEVTLYSMSLPSANFKGEKSKCETQGANYVMTMVSQKANLAYTSIYFLTQPTASQTYDLVKYSEVELTSTKAWALVTIIKDNKSWRAKNGKLKIALENGKTKVSFDSVGIECTSNVTDTTYYMMKGNFFCK